MGLSTVASGPRASTFVGPVFPRGQCGDSHGILTNHLMPYNFHPDLRTPPKRSVLWRYMDFAKFVETLESRTLWFARLDQLEDPLEGTHTDAELSGLRKRLEEHRAEQLINAFRRAREGVYVNCWRSGPNESLAMWDLYGRGSGIVAIKSTVGRLREAVAAYGKPIYISKTRYVDWSDAHGLDNVLVACSRKDLSYEHEAEVRAIIMRDSEDWPESGKLGIAVAVDVKKLIREVIVGPREHSWVVRLGERVMKRYGLSQPVVASDRLRARP